MPSLNEFVTRLLDILSKEDAPPAAVYETVDDKTLPEKSSPPIVEA